MGLTRQYLRYVPSSVFGLIGSQKSNVVYLEIHGVLGKYCMVGACEDVIVWDLRTGEKVLTLKGDNQEVTKVARSPDKKHVAVGYNNGMIRIFDLTTGDSIITFSGHKSAITALKYDCKGLRLASGAKDTDVIVWDIVNESGLYRMKGHKGMVTQAEFLKTRNVLITSSKDTLMKFWDLDTQHCFKTLVGHRSEVYDFVLLRNETRLVTGSGDMELRVWDINYMDKADEGTEAIEPVLKKARISADDRLANVEEETEEKDELQILTCTKVGSVMRQGKDRVVSMATDQQETILTCHGNDSSLEVFHLPSEADLKKLLSKRQKKMRQKLRQVTEEGQEEKREDEAIVAELKLEEEIRKMCGINMSGKIISADVVMEGPTVAKVVALLNKNMIEFCSLRTDEKKTEATNRSQLSMHGHHSDVRTVCFSSDNTAILSASAESIKIWNRASLQSIRTIACDYALCSMFAPGDRHVIIGTKSGKLQIFDIGAGVMLESIEAHTGAVWSVAMAPDKRSIVSGSADKHVKFWNFELISSEDSTTSSKRLTLELTRTLMMDEDVLCVKYSPDQRLLAVSLLDSTVKVFFADTLKFFLSLYGHKLPVLCMDISYDSTMIVTGSADRNVKIWGLDFGDCHKSIFAHDDSIMCIQFISKTHMFFSGGKDRKVKQWDADNFEHIITLEGHHAEVWCLDVTSSGNYLVTGSHDKSLRLWEKTQEPLVLEEEREMEREKEYEESLAQGGEPVVPGETNTEAGLAGKKTIETVKAAERLMEAVELYKEETEKFRQHALNYKKVNKQLPGPELHPMFLTLNVKTPEQYMLAVLKKVRSSELEEALLVLPFSYVIDLMKIFDIFISHSWEVELTCRCLFFLLRIHHGQITTNQVLLPIVDRLRSQTKERVRVMKDQIGFNLAGMQFLQADIESAENIMFFSDATGKFQVKKKKQKKKAVLAFKV
ncbi:hypothetical protein CHS0354_034171 [Potamilus streckersoni]|uniref:Small-subunit processome Utp12 domain-containing protein n=1 Tax=Potamilus streckersoni TaxID=2493646 RepID=A0AAE0VG68_9BIVA|nr:hypothetical protein CHS0354_034171 [Potamilus streckersoni]